MGYFIPKEYIFEQATPASEWVITHGSGKPSVDVFFIDTDGTTQKIIPMRVDYISDSQLKITFSRPFAGMAKIVG